MGSHLRILSKGVPRSAMAIHSTCSMETWGVGSSDGRINACGLVGRSSYKMAEVEWLSFSDKEACHFKIYPKGRINRTNDGLDVVVRPKILNIISEADQLYQHIISYPQNLWVRKRFKTNTVTSTTR